MSRSDFRAWLPWRIDTTGSERAVCFCFPPAGGNANIFRTWSLSGELRGAALCPVSLAPAREAYARGEPLTLEVALEILGEHILAASEGRDIVLFGHSVGAFLAAAMATSLSTSGTTVRQLFLSAMIRPDLLPPTDVDGLMSLTGGEIFDRGETPLSPQTPFRMAGRHEIEADLALLRRDFPFQLDMPVVAFSGMSDRIAPPRDVDSWRDLALAGFRHVSLDAQHFYLRDRRTEILAVIDGALGGDGAAFKGEGTVQA